MQITSLIFKVNLFLQHYLLTTFSGPSPALDPWSAEMRKKKKAISTLMELLF